MSERIRCCGPGPMRFGAALAIAFAVELAWALTQKPAGGRSGGGAVSSIAEIGRVVFTDYAFPFEVTSVLILVAMVGAVVLARRRDPRDRASERPPSPDA